MHLHYAKTPRGRDEIAHRSVKSSRTARNLLLIIDDSRPVSHWMALIHGASQEDIDFLVQSGLVEASSSQRQRPAVRANSIEAALATLNYEQLYTLITSQARDRLGLLKGYLMILAVEKCANEAELRELAVKFMGMVREVQGEPAARRMRLALGMST